MKTIYKIHLGLALAMLATIAAGVYVYNQRILTPVEEPAKVQEKTYQNLFYGLRMGYSSPLSEGEPRFEVGNFFAADEQVKRLTSLVIPKETYPNSNFFEAFINLAVQNSSEDLCVQIRRPGDAREIETESLNINGRQYHQAELREGAAGTFSRSDVYHTYHNGNCFEVSLNFFQGNIANYDPPIQEVDEAAVYRIMENSLATLEIK